MAKSNRTPIKTWVIKKGSVEVKLGMYAFTVRDDHATDENDAPIILQKGFVIEPVNHAHGDDFATNVRQGFSSPRGAAVAVANATGEAGDLNEDQKYLVREFLTKYLEPSITELTNRSPNFENAHIQRTNPADLYPTDYDATQSVSLYACATDENHNIGYGLTRAMEDAIKRHHKDILVAVFGDEPNAEITGQSVTASATEKTFTRAEVMAMVEVAIASAESHLGAKPQRIKSSMQEQMNKAQEKGQEV